MGSSLLDGLEIVIHCLCAVHDCVYSSFQYKVVWKNIHFLMWDIGGQESLRSAWNTYYTNTEVN